MDSLLKLTLRQGTVYYMKHRDLTSPLDHFFIVINSSPCLEEIILLSVITSKSDKVKKVIKLRDFSNETFVEILPTNYRFNFRHL